MTEGAPKQYPSRRQLREQGWTTGSIDALTETGSVRLPVTESEESVPASAPVTEAASSVGAEVPVAAPRSRRERREQERLIATGVIPVIATTASEPNPIAVEQASPPENSPERDKPASGVLAPEQADQEEHTPAVEEPVAPATAEASATPGQLRPLTRRERREMERRGEPVPDTGWIPVISEATAAEALTTTDSLGVEDQADDTLGESTPLGTNEGGESPNLTIDDADGDRVDEVVGFGAQSPRSVSTSYSAQAAAFSVDVVVDDSDGENPPEQDSGPSRGAAGPLPPVFQIPPSAGETHTAPAREVSVGSDATHALILPVAPSTDLTGPMGNTGEVLVTGNLQLPKYVSEQALTGGTDFADDFAEFETVSTESFTAPVRATDAVSTRTSQIETPMIRSPRWGSASIALGVSAAVLGLTAVGLLALALLTDIIELPF